MSTFINLLPAKLVLKLASPYIAGRNAEEALSLSYNLFGHDRFTSTIDILGEAATSDEECNNLVQQCIKIIDLLHNQPLPTQNKQEQPTISFKPSMFCASYSADFFPNKKNLADGYQRMEQVVSYAFKHNINTTIEAEDASWTEYQLDTYFSLRNAGYSNLGTVLQTRLFRTAEDIKRFDEKSRIRLVIGIYEESHKIAYTDKKYMKELLINYSRVLLNNGTYIELATHDEDYINKFLANVISPLRLNTDRYEFQFLLGVPRYELQKRLVQSGNVVRLYLPFGPDELAGPYCKRRLQTNPNLLIYGLKNLTGIH